LATLIAFPFWLLTLTIILVLGYWYWAQAANIVGLQRGAAVTTTAKDAEKARRDFVLTALGGYAEPYDVAVYETQNSRAQMATMDKTVKTPFEWVGSVTVKARMVTRRERFYARPNDPKDPSKGWE
jgi:CHASE3 domain sensor protein